MVRWKGHQVVLLPRVKQTYKLLRQMRKKDTRAVSAMRVLKTLNCYESIFFPTQRTLKCLLTVQLVAKVLGILFPNKSIFQSTKLNESLNAAIAFEVSPRCLH